MSTLILRPIADGDHIGLPDVVGATEHWDALNDSSPDDASSYVSHASGNSSYTYDLYVVGSPFDTIIQMRKINSVKIYFRVSTRFSQTGYAKPVLKLAESEYNGSEVTHSGANWVTYSQTWTTHPGSGLSWRWQDICGMQVGIAMKCGATGYALGCTQLYIEIDYDSSAALPISSTILRPSSVGDVTGLDYSTPAAHWDAVNDVSPDDGSTYVNANTPGTYKYDLYGIDTSAFTACRILGIVISFRISINLGDYGYAKPALKISGSTFYGTEVYYHSATWANFSSTFLAINPSTGQPWTWADVCAMQIGIAMKSVTSGYPVMCTQVYATVYHYPVAGKPRVQLIGLW